MMIRLFLILWVGGGGWREDAFLHQVSLQIPHNTLAAPLVLTYLWRGWKGEERRGEVYLAQVMTRCCGNEDE